MVVFRVCAGCGCGAKSGAGMVGDCASLGVGVPGAVRFVGQYPGFILYYHYFLLC